MDVGQTDGGARTGREARVEQVDTHYPWGDLVLPDEQLDHLRSIARHLHGRRSSGHGIETAVQPMQPVLFLGIAGTGKTMAAQIIAADVDAPVRTLDLAKALAGAGHQIERNIARTFQSAARVGAVLVIDDSGGLLRRSAPLDRRGPSPDQGIRTDEAQGSLVERLRTGDDRSTDSNGHDAPGSWLPRLLTRADRYDGLVIFMSTATHGIDPALVDRVGAVVTFPLPDATARKEIWRRSLPADAQLTESNLDYLAGWLQWSGGTIHRCCLAAADEAARERVPVQLRHVALVRGRRYPDDGALAHPATVPSTRAPSTSVRPPAPRRPKPVAAAGHVGSRTTTPAPVASAPITPAPAPGHVGLRPPVLEPVGSGPAPTSATTAAAPTHSGRRPWPLVIAIAAAAAVLIGGIIAVLTSHSSSPSATRAASMGAVRLSIPSSWRRSTLPAPPALGLTGELVLVSPAPASGELVIGKAAQNSSSPLPPPLPAMVPSTVTPQIVKIGQLVFYRYPGPPQAGEYGMGSIFAMPTTAGTIVGVCRPRGAGSAFTTSCVRVLATLRLTSGRALPLTLSTAYARELNAAISRLNAVRSSAGTRLATATTVPAQATAASQLAQAHDRAASALVHLSAGVAAAANAALAHALLLNAGAYHALAQAAAHRNIRAYSAARADLAHSAQALNLAFDQLRRLGYRVA